MSKFKPLQFVRPLAEPRAVGIIKEISKHTCSVSWIGNNYNQKSAWWSEPELEVIDSLPRILSRTMAHPFGTGETHVNEAYPL